MDGDEVLQGGVANAGAVIRSGMHVIRPANAHSTSIHALLRHLRSRGFNGASEVVGVEDGSRERLVFIEGDVPLPPFPPWWRHDPVLASMAALMRKFHDASADFVAAPDATWCDEMRDPTPGTDAVLCHNDVCPENVVYRDGVAIALIDFDFAAPGRRVWDLGAMVMMCAPLDSPENAAHLGMQALDPITRVRVAADGYGLDTRGRAALLDVFDEKMTTTGDFVRARVEAGESAFVQMWNESGGEARVERRKHWYAASRPAIAAALG